MRWDETVQGWLKETETEDVPESPCHSPQGDWEGPEETQAINLTWREIVVLVLMGTVPAGLDWPKMSPVGAASVVQRGQFHSV